jgi:Uma2 family endonuclease
MSTELLGQRIWTDDELLGMEDAKFWQLVDGELYKMSPAGAEHGEICTRLLSRVYVFASSKRLGRVYDSSTGFRMSPENCFSADVSFVARARVASVLPDPEKFVQGAPDFVVEVLSPRSTLKELERKIELFFGFGTHSAWLVLPRKRTVRVYSDGREYQTLDTTGILAAEECLPGLKIPVREVFEDPVFES